MSNKEFKVLIMKMFTGRERRVEKLHENFNINIEKKTFRVEEHNCNEKYTRGNQQ